MEEHLESGLGDAAENAIVGSFFRSTESCVLLSLSASKELSGFIFGIFPLFTIQMDIGYTLVKGFTSFSAVYVVSNESVTEQNNRNKFQNINVAENSSGHRVLKMNMDMLNCSSCSFHWFEQTASLYLVIHSEFSKLQDLVVGFSRKWKDATRVILPKLSLLQGILDGYQISMTATQFMYTIAQCGLWHPAALTAFSQHWNEQGISRLRSAVDATSTSIRKSLQLRAVPIATNIALRCRCVSDSLLLYTILNDMRTYSAMYRTDTLIYPTCFVIIRTTP